MHSAHTQDFNCLDFSEINESFALYEKFNSDFGQVGLINNENKIKTLIQVNYQFSNKFDFIYIQHRTCETISFSYDNCPFSMDGSILSNPAFLMPASCYLLQPFEHLMALVENFLYNPK